MCFDLFFSWTLAVISVFDFFTAAVVYLLVRLLSGAPLLILLPLLIVICGEIVNIPEYVRVRCWILNDIDMQQREARYLTYITGKSVLFDTERHGQNCKVTFPLNDTANPEYHKLCSYSVGLTCEKCNGNGIVTQASRSQQWHSLVDLFNQSINQSVHHSLVSFTRLAFVISWLVLIHISLYLFVQKHHSLL